MEKYTEPYGHERCSLPTLQLFYLQDHVCICVCVYIYTYIYTHIYIYIQGVPGGMDKTSGECSLC